MAAVAAAAQEPARTFDVVSIKRSVPDTRTGSSIGIQPGGRFVMVNGRIAGLISTAYPTDVSEYIGAPDWITVDRYDVTAVAPPGTTRADIEPMMRALLAERFNFKGRYETRQEPVYELVLARPSMPLPSALRRVDVDCDARREAGVRGEKLPELPRLSNGQLPCSMSMNGSDFLKITSGGMTMANFGRSIQSLAGRVILDRTGLEGSYEFTVSFTQNPGPNSEHVDVFTALREQLGLELRGARGPVRMLVIDHIDRPTEN